MKLPVTLSAYIVKVFFLYLLIVLISFSVLIISIDAIELLRKLSGKEVGFFSIIEMIFLKLPIFLQEILPFIVLVASVLTYSKLARTNELVIVRAAGISAWEFMMPCIVAAFIFGLVVVTILNPVASAMINRYETLRTKYFYNANSKLEISDSGFWLKQIELEKDENKTKEIIIHSKQLSSDKEVTLGQVLVMSFDGDSKFTSRIDGDSAKLVDGQWHITNAKRTDDQANIQILGDYYIPTKVKADDLQKSLSEPETISFWQLPAFIRKLQNNGFSPTSHILQFHKILSMPLYFSAMVLIGAIFTLKSPRISRPGYSIAISIVIGFIIYFLSNLVFSIGLSGSIPVVFSAWTPIVVTCLAGIYMLLHLEDG
jgi:lipopolysaccharide export system permease protein